RPQWASRRRPHRDAPVPPPAAAAAARRLSRKRRLPEESRGAEASDEPRRDRRSRPEARLRTAASRPEWETTARRWRPRRFPKGVSAPELPGAFGFSVLAGRPGMPAIIVELAMIFWLVVKSPVTTDYIVVGSGIAGLRAAIEIALAEREVILLTKDLPTDSNT